MGKEVTAEPVEMGGLEKGVYELHVSAEGHDDVSQILRIDQDVVNAEGSKG